MANDCSGGERKLVSEDGRTGTLTADSFAVVSDLVFTAKADHYCLKEEIGRGGMGTVFRAEDTRLCRSVAVKVLRGGRDRQASHHFDRRFVNEARITGQLQHPGIPPIHELGRLSDGRLFLAMKLVCGNTLHDLLKQRTDPADDLSRFVGVFEQVCHAVGYAHACGVIHRDLKPSNIMVGRHGEVQVMDWGLAKVIGSSTATGDSTTIGLADRVGYLPSDGGETPGGAEAVTRAGQVVGTPAYMAPEQARGDVQQLDVRCDVFGLGAILCEILTGRPPYTSTSSRGVHRLAMQGDLDEVFRDLEVCKAEPDIIELCRRCLAPDREDRPVDGNAVATEVTRIRQAAENRARQAELDKAEALGRETEHRKRRRQMLMAFAAIVAVLAIGAMGTTLGMLRAQRNRQVADAARQRAQQSALEALAQRDAKSRVLAKLEAALVAERKATVAEKAARREALAALGYMTDEVLTHELANRDQLTDETRHHLEGVLEYYERLAHLGGDEKETWEIRVVGYHRVAMLQSYLGMPDEARANYRRSLELMRRIADDPKAGRSELSHLAENLRLLSMTLGEDNESLKECEALARQAVQIVEKLVAEHPGDASLRRSLANSLDNLASHYQRVGRTTEAVAVYKRAIRIARELVVQFPQATIYRSNLAGIHRGLGSAYHVQDRDAEAEDEIAKAVELLQDLASGNEDDPDTTLDLAGSLNEIALVRESMRQYQAARANYQQAVKLLVPLVERFPMIARFRDELASGYEGLGRIFRDTARFSESEAEYRKAVELLNQLVKQCPHRMQFRQHLAVVLNNLGLLYGDMTCFPKAIDAFEKAASLNAQIVRQCPGIPEYRRDWATNYSNLGRTYVEMGRYPRAEEAYRRSIEILQPLVDKYPNKHRFACQLSSYYSDLAELYSQMGNSEKTDEMLTERVEMLRLLNQRLTNGPAAQVHQALNHMSQGLFFLQNDRLVEAKVEYEKAIELWEGYCNGGETSPTTRQNLANCYHNMALLLKAEERYDDAKQVLLKAIEIREQLLSATEYDVTLHEYLANAYGVLKQLYARNGQTGLVEETLNREMDVREGILARFPHRLDQQKAMARSFCNAGVAFSDAGQEGKAEEMYGRALAILEPIVSSDPSALRYQKILANTHHNLANILHSDGRVREAESGYRRAIAIRVALLPRLPEDEWLRIYLSWARSCLASICEEDGRLAEAAEQYEMAVKLRQELAERFASDEDHPYGLASAHRRLAECYTRLGRTKEAVDQYRHAQSVMGRLVVECPEEIRYQSALAACHRGLGDLYIRVSRYQEALGELERAVELGKSIVARNPNSVWYADDLRTTRTLLCAAYAGLNQTDRALAVADTIKDMDGTPAERAYEAAVAMAGCVDIAQRQTEQEGNVTEEKRRFFGEASLRFLKLAIDRGFEDWKRIRSDPALASIRSLKPFEALMSTVTTSVATRE